MARPPNLEARQHILDTASELFYGHGYKGVSMDEVAARAGLKKSNLFHYYPSKDELGAAVLDRVIASYREHIAGQLAQDGDPVRLVEGMFAGYAALMEEKHCTKGCIIGNFAGELSDESEALRLKIAGLFDFWTAQAAALLERHRAAGYFVPRMDPAQAARAIVSLLQGATLVSKASRSSDALKAAGAMAAAYLKSLKA